MSLGKFRTYLYKTARFIGDLNAVRKGTIHKRVKNRVVGRAVTKRLF